MAVVEEARACRRGAPAGRRAPSWPGSSGHSPFAGVLARRARRAGRRRAPRTAVSDGRRLVGSAVSLSDDDRSALERSPAYARCPARRLGHEGRRSRRGERRREVQARTPALPSLWTISTDTGRLGDRTKWNALSAGIASVPARMIAAHVGLGHGEGRERDRRPTRSGARSTSRFSTRGRRSRA